MTFMTKQTNYTIKKTLEVYFDVVIIKNNHEEYHIFYPIEQRNVGHASKERIKTNSNKCKAMLEMKSLQIVKIMK
ncbi:hypothetical protein CR513_07683, partial [Mucuna pruriens]